MFFFAAFKPVLPCAGAEEAAVRDVPGSHRAAGSGLPALRNAQAGGRNQLLNEPAAATRYKIARNRLAP